MKKSFKAFLGISALALTSAAAVSSRAVKNAALKLPESFTLTAHTGCEDTPDNSLDSIRAGIEAGANVVEFDLRFDSDGTPILSHDKPIGGEPTLESAFSLLAEYEGIKANIDCKTTENLKAVQDLAQKYNLIGRVFYTGIEEKDVEAAKATPLIPYFLNMKPEKSKVLNEKYLNELCNRVENAGAMGINLQYLCCSRRLVEFFRQRNLLVSVWTANTEQVMRYCLYLSPDNITTRKPSVMTEIIADKK